jgi:RNase P subunit RPR2
MDIFIDPALVDDFIANIGWADIQKETNRCDIDSLIDGAICVCCNEIYGKNHNYRVKTQPNDYKYIDVNCCGGNQVVSVSFIYSNVSNKYKRILKERNLVD